MDAPVRLGTPLRITPSNQFSSAIKTRRRTTSTTTCRECILRSSALISGNRSPAPCSSNCTLFVYPVRGGLYEALAYALGRSQVVSITLGWRYIGLDYCTYETLEESGDVRTYPTDYYKSQTNHYQIAVFQISWYSADTESKANKG